jgi:hypothetical protein
MRLVECDAHFVAMIFVMKPRWYIEGKIHAKALN